MQTSEQQRLTVDEYIKLLSENTHGVKHDQGKPQWDLLPWEELEDVVKVLTFGATKYSPDNWKKVPNSPSRYMDATMRHLVAYRTGETFDKESNQHHLAHAMCCLLFMLWHDKNDNAA